MQDDCETAGAGDGSVSNPNYLMGAAPTAVDSTSVDACVNADTVMQDDRETAGDEHRGASSAAAGMVAMPLFAEHGAMAAALSMLSLAQRAAEASIRDDERVSILRNFRWSKLNTPLLWAAADGDDSHPVLEWLVRAAHGGMFTIPVIGTAPMSGPFAVREAWLLLCAGMRSLGISSRLDLSEWLSQNGHGRVTAG
eukprot:10888942-Karenia_brevis.AAC.1